MSCRDSASIRGTSTSVLSVVVFFFKQKTAYEMRISDWSSDVCSSDLTVAAVWRQEKMADEAKRIGMLGKELYERLAGAAGSLKKLGNRLNGAVAEIGRASCRERVCQYV